MKKILMIAAVAGLAMASCKKDRTCTCTVTAVSSTVNGATQTINTTPRTQEVKYTKVTKNGASCNSGERTETSSFVNNNVTYTTVDVNKYDCTLK
jgi:hypothetical protein